ncbi:MAG: NAD+ synthase [Actinomycetota bacterium]
MLRIALCQANTTVGDLDGNVERIAAMARRATELGADLAVFPELAVTGYPPEDLILRPGFIADAGRAVSDLAARTADGCVVVVGAPDPAPEGGVHNAALVLEGGAVVKRYAKANLTNYGVFDERRTFVAGFRGARAEVRGRRIGLSVCEDAWQDGAPFDAYARERPPVIVNLNASPFHRGKTDERIRVCADRARQTGAWIVYVNAVGGQDELVFDGGSLVVDPAGEVRHRAARFEEDLLVVEIADDGTSTAEDERAAWPDEVEAVYRALVLGLGDYVRKNGFRGVILGLSGGIDSALVAALATDALGPDAVRALAMPSPYSSPESLEDAAEVARRLGIRLDVAPITPALDAYRATLGELFGAPLAGLAEENLQARIRGNLLMAVSNAEGPLVLATGNKSEMAVGYSTLYGDLAGGFAPIKDVPKTLVYDLVRWRNARVGEPPIPDRVIAKAPSAELRPGQKDTDALPPYDELDPVLAAYVEEDRSPEEIAAAGVDRALVDRVVAMVDRAEYKRRQAPPGVKITPKAFGRDRRLPITNRYRRG